MATRMTPSGSPGTRTGGAAPTTPQPSTGQAGQMGQTGQAVPQERIAMRAYEKWCQNGCPDGTADRDWQEAEQELRQEMTQAGKQQPGMRR